MDLFRVYESDENYAFCVCILNTKILIYLKIASKTDEIWDTISCAISNKECKITKKVWLMIMTKIKLNYK